MSTTNSDEQGKRLGNPEADAQPLDEAQLDQVEAGSGTSGRVGGIAVDPTDEAARRTFYVYTSTIKPPTP